MGDTPFGITDSDLAAGVKFAVRVTARDLASAATTSLVKGTDFGDNIVSALPGAVGSALGEGLQENTSLQKYLNDAASQGSWPEIHDALTVPTLATHWMLGNIDWSIAAAFAVGMVPASFAAARVGMKLPERIVRPAFGAVVLVFSLWFVAVQLG